MIISTVLTALLNHQIKRFNMNTLFLMPSTWDLELDVHGNIAISRDIYAIAQDVASACRVFLNDLYFNQSEGIPYLEEILGQSRYSLSLYRTQLEDQAKTVPEVASAQAILSTAEGRVIVGRIEFTTTDGRNGALEL